MKISNFCSLQNSILEEGLLALSSLKQKTGKGSEFTGWLNPYDNKEEYARIKSLGKRLYEEAEALVVIGIGGSYLGARAAIEMINSNRFNEENKGPKIYFAGNGLCGEETLQTLRLVQNKNYYVNVISKSGTTLEPALAFRIFREDLEKKLGKEASKHIFCTTDAKKGVLKELAQKEGYECFVIPDNIGGRYSVLTPVGLFPMAAAGLDVDAVLEGARKASLLYTKEDEENPALLYAAARQSLYRQGKSLEVLSYPGENLRNLAEWWKQLYGESEGKEQGGIFPAALQLTADLHSLGQYMQDGKRNIMETMLMFEEGKENFAFSKEEENSDGLNYVAGKTYNEIFKAAALGVKQAHEEGGVPVCTLTFSKIDEETLGEIFQFFEISCAISAYIQGVNPFNQPGVENYKKNMFRLLGK